MNSLNSVHARRDDDMRRDDPDPGSIWHFQTWMYTVAGGANGRTPLRTTRTQPLKKVLVTESAPANCVKCQCKSSVYSCVFPCV
eukprot:COSAG02_NODE_42105_length_387_cov_70.142361_1_plen_83_part_10